MGARGLLVGLTLALALSACGRVAESRFNPFNWFGEAEAEEATPVVLEDEDTRPRIAQVTSLRIEETPTGAIVRATGLPPTQGWYGASLVRESDDPINGELVFVFRAEPPPGTQRISTVQSRELSVARAISAQDLANTRIIRVIGASNMLVSRR